jgi:hypothetical protein
MINTKKTLWQKMPEELKADLWFLFEQSEFYTFQHVRNVIAAIQFVQQTGDNDYCFDVEGKIIESSNGLPIGYDFEILENGEEKIKPYITEGENLYTAYIFKEKTVIIDDLTDNKHDIPTNVTLNVLEKWLELLKVETRQLLKQQTIQELKRIEELQLLDAPNNAQKFELQVLTALQKCDTKQEFDLLAQKIVAIAANSELTQKLLVLIQNKRDLYQL